MFFKKYFLIFINLGFLVNSGVAQINGFEEWNFGALAGSNFSLLTNLDNTFNLTQANNGPYLYNKSTKFPIEYWGGLYANSPIISARTSFLLRLELFVNRMRDNITFYNDSVDFQKFNIKKVYLGFHLMMGMASEDFQVYCGFGYSYVTNPSSVNIAPINLFFEREVREVFESKDYLYIPLIINYRLKNGISFQARANISIRDMIYIKSNGLNFDDAPSNGWHSFGLSVSYDLTPE